MEETKTRDNGFTDLTVPCTKCHGNTRLKRWVDDSEGFGVYTNCLHCGHKLDGSYVMHMTLFAIRARKQINGG